MRKVWLGAAVASLLIPLGGGVAYAGVGNDGGATIVKGATCSIRTNPTGNPKTPTTDMQAEITPSGQVNLVCHAQAPAGTTIAPFNQSGFLCIAGPAGVTYNSHVVWTPSGRGTLTCHGTIPPTPPS
jgi:hypothetical protein